MIHAFEKIQAIAGAAVGAIGDELTFTFPEVLEVIQLCTKNEIAVLGVEIFLAKNDGYYYASGCSDYDLRLARKWKKLQKGDWGHYVNENNSLAREVVRQNPTGDDHVYVLTTATWGEHCKLRVRSKLRQQGRL